MTDSHAEQHANANFHQDARASLPPSQSPLHLFRVSLVLSLVNYYIHCSVGMGKLYNAASVLPNTSSGSLLAQ